MALSNQYEISGSAAEIYHQYMVPAIFRPFAIDLIEFAELQSGERVLDVACGTGVVTRLASAKVGGSGKVIGLDSNPAMLEVARTIATENESAIEWIEAKASEITLLDAGVDVVICQHGLQYFPDRPAALSEMHRVLSQGGRLVLNIWRPVRYNPGHAVFAEVLEKRVSAEAAATRRAPFRLCERDELRGLVSNAGFHDILIRLTSRVTRFDSAEAMMRIMMAGTPLASAMKEGIDGTLTEVIHEVTKRLNEFTDDCGLALPMQAWVVTASA